MEEIEKLKAELAALQHRLNDLTDFMEQAVMPLHWLDRHGVIIWANQAELDLLGYTLDEYIGQPVSRFYEHPEIIADILERLGNGETLINYPARLRSKDGSVKLVLINSNVKRENGEFIHTRCFTRDVTAYFEEEKRMADVLTELEESDARLMMAMEATGLGTWEYDLRNGKLHWSDACKRIYDLPLDRPVDYDAFLKHIFPEDRARVARAIAAAIAEVDYDIEFRILRFDDQSLRWIRSKGKVYFNKDGQAERFIGTVIDFTNRKLAEEKSAMLSAIVASSDDAIISKNFDSIVTSWNAAAERIFGYTAEEMIGESIVKLIPPDRLDEEPHIIARLKKGERVDHFETRRMRKDGSLLDVSLTISPIRDEQMNLIGVSKIARDITERKQEEIRKNDFIAMVSHELKTPLTSMKAYLQVLLSQSKKDGNAFQLKALTRAEMQAERMAVIIHDFLTLARLEDGKMVLNRSVFSLHALVEEVMAEAPFLTSTHEIKMIYCQDIQLNADREKIGHVLINLLSNAIKYSPNGGRIEIGCQPQNEQIKVFVKDRGIGISQEDQAHLFERFYRAKDARIKTVSGFGIGLFLVAQILRFHGSRIDVESTPDEGSTFYFLMDRI